MKMMRKNMALLLASFACASAFAQNTIKVDLGNARFARELVETWISEYGKQNPGFAAEIVSGQSDADVQFSLVANRQVQGGTIVGQYFILPIGHAGGALLNDRKIKKGLGAKQLKDLFVQKDFVDDFETDEDDKFDATVYSLAGKKAAITNLFARHLGTDPSKLKGKKIIGQEQSALSRVQNDETGVSFNVIGLVYDVRTRRPADGIAVLPVDLDGNGKVSEEERQALTSMDNLMAFLELAGKTGLPSEEIAVSATDSRSKNFAEWIAADGQKYLKQFGFVGNQVKVAHK